MKTHNIIPAIGCLSILTSTLNAETTPRPDKTAASATQEAIRPDIRQFKQIWQDIFNTLDTIQDTASANASVPKLLDLSKKMTQFQTNHPYDQLTQSEQTFIQNAIQEIRETHQEKKSAQSIIGTPFYQSAALFVMLTDNDCPVSPMFRDDDTEQYAMHLAFKAQEKVDQPNDPYMLAKDDMVKDAEPRHAHLLAQPASPYLGGMGLTEEDAVILHETDEEKQQELQYAYLQTVYPTAKPFYGLVQATPDRGFYNIIIVNISDDIEKRTGKHPEQPALIPVYFRIDTPADKNEKREEN